MASSQGGHTGPGEPIIPGSIRGEEHLVGWSTGDKGSTKLYVSNLDFLVTDGDIERIFSEFGQLEKHSIHYDKYGYPKGTAEVVYKRHSDALAAMENLSNFKLGGKTIATELVGLQSLSQLKAPVYALPAGALPTGGAPGTTDKDLGKRKRDGEDSGRKRRFKPVLPLGKTLPLVPVHKLDDDATCDQVDIRRYRVQNAGSVRLVGHIQPGERTYYVSHLEMSVSNCLVDAGVDPALYCKNIFYSNRTESWDSIESLDECSCFDDWKQFQEQLRGVLVMKGELHI